MILCRLCHYKCFVRTECKWKTQTPAWPKSFRWRHNERERDSVSNHKPRYSLLQRLFRRRSKKTPQLRVTGLCAGNLPVTGEFPAQMTSNAENVPIWWRHHMPCILWNVHMALYFVLLWLFNSIQKLLHSNNTVTQVKTYTHSDIYSYTHARVSIYMHKDIYMFVVNIHAQAQASDFRIERRLVNLLCWRQDSNSGPQTPNCQQTECPLTNRLSYWESNIYIIYTYIYTYIHTYTYIYIYIHIYKYICILTCKNIIILKHMLTKYSWDVLL